MSDENSLAWVIADMQKWEDEYPRPDEWKMREWIGKLRALEAAERTRNERASPSAAVTVTDALNVARRIADYGGEPMIRYAAEYNQACADLVQLEAALAAAPGGKEKASDDHPTPEEFARYLAWRFKEDGVEVKPEDALRVSRDLLNTFSIWNVMATG